MRTACAALLAAAVISVSCGPREGDVLDFMRQPEVLERESRFERALSERSVDDTSGAALARWVLPQSLREVSGLALTDDDRLFAHGDELGIITEIDYRRGVLVKQFVIGRGAASVDFEGIAVTPDAIFMIASNGDLYEFGEGAPGERVRYAVHEMGLEEECEFEGVAYDSAIASLLLACKNVYNESFSDSLVIFRWKLAERPNTAVGVSRLSIPLANVTAPLESKTLRPSDITVDPHSGNYLLVSAQDKALVELTREGEVVSVRRIPDEHEQAEGLAITKDGLLIIGDEAVRSAAVITLYRRP